MSGHHPSASETSSIGISLANRWWSALRCLLGMHGLIGQHVALKYQAFLKGLVKSLNRSISYGVVWRGQMYFFVFIA